MPFVTAAGVQINFPFEPYPCQIDYMEKVITCLRQGYNGILESPTGTGKTLCLLCSCLAWLEDKKAQILSQRWKLSKTEPGSSVLDQFKDQLAQQLDDAAGAWSGELAAPKIIYASRTHSQLSQAVQELKRTAYSHFKVCVLGSREQLCVHPIVMKEENNNTKVHLCRAKVSSRTCIFYNGVENAKQHFLHNVMDIEDLVQLGQKHRCCPYYMTKELKSDADIIFMPYNYLLDPRSRKAHGIELQGNIVIFDEAHNLEKICEESASFDLSSADIAAAIRDINELSEKLQNAIGSEAFDMTGSDGAAQDFTLEEVLRLKAQILHLEEEIDNIHLPRKTEGITKPGSFIFEIMEKVNLSFETKFAVIELIDKMVTYLANENSSSVLASKGNGLSKFADIIKTIFSRPPDERINISSHQKAISKHYKVHIQEEIKNQAYKKKSDNWEAAAASSNTQKTTRILSYWCFSPGHAMEDLKAHGVKSIILTSGTLSPITSFKLEMGIDFQVELENPHVIDNNQVWLGIIGRGPDGVLLSSTYENRSKDEYQTSLGNCIVNFSRIVPHGLLLFFPSYPVMNKCLDNWQRVGIWKSMENHKAIFVEPRFKAEFNTAIFSYYQAVNKPTSNGAIFAAVCRGKVSEGLDFSDNNGRAVVITGLPFPPRMDPKVMLKMQFLDEARIQNGKGLSGQEWYRQQASRAVNQAIGRVIRHKDDYGAIILCDNRFSQTAATSQLPSWIRPHVKIFNNFGSAVKDLMMFFKKAQQIVPAPQVRIKSTTGSEQSGCQGAYFQSASSRQKPIQVENIAKSGSVSIHVRSLRQSHDDLLALDKLKEEYGAYKMTAKTEASSNHGLLTALENNEAKLSEDKPDGMGSVFQGMVQPVLQDMRPKATKKIIIKKSSNIKKHDLQTAEEYLAEVREALSHESYTFFSKTLANYKKTEDFTAMVTGLAAIFTDHTNKYPLFRKFYRFVRPHHKQKYDQTCKELTGEGCGFKPEHATVKKNPVNKKRKLETTQSDVHPMDQKSDDNCNSQKASSNSSDTILPNNSSPMSVTEANCGSTSGDPFTHPRYTCSYCKKDAYIPLIAPCKHVCCLECWKICIRESKECPECHQRVRRKNLSRMMSDHVQTTPNAQLYPVSSN